ncbi:MAG: polysaccharide biosynthesis tyrosine autokinase [Mycetocola sp.]
MEPQEYFAILRKRALMIIVLGILGAAAGFGYASTLPVKYTSTSSVFVSAERGETSSELVQGATYTQNLVESYVALATMPAVLSPVIEELSLDVTPQALANSVTVDAPLNTVIIEIHATNASPEMSAKIADSVANSLAQQAQELSPTGGDDKPSINMELVAPAQIPSFPTEPNTRLYIITLAAAGLLTGVIYAFARELLDTRVRSSKDLQRISDAPLIAAVPRARRQGYDPIVMRAEPHGPRAEAYRRLLANIQFSDVDRGIRSVLVTSALTGEGKTTTSVNLALAAAERTGRVLLIDADLRRPSVAEYFALEGAVGLTTVLKGDIEPHEAIVSLKNGMPDVLPAGIAPPNPSQLLGSESMTSLMAELHKTYDFIVVDSPPVVPVTDALTLTRLIDGTIVIARYMTTRRQQLGRALDNLMDVNARVLGIVLNRVKQEDPSPYYVYAEHGGPGRRSFKTLVADRHNASSGQDDRKGHAKDKSSTVRPEATETIETIETLETFAAIEDVEPIDSPVASTAPDDAASAAVSGSSDEPEESDERQTSLTSSRSRSKPSGGATLTDTERP